MKKTFRLLLMMLLSTFIFAVDVSEMFYQGMELFNKQKYKKSVKVFKKLIKKFPESSDLGRVYAQIGKAYEAMGKYEKAFNAYEDVFLKAPDYPTPQELIEREFKIALRYEKETENGILGINFSEPEKMAIKIYTRVTKNFPFGKYADTALLKVIKLQIKAKDYDKALKNITLFKKAYEKSEHKDEVFFLAGMIYYQQLKKIDYDQSTTKEAIENFELYIKTFPEGSFVSKAQEKIQQLNDLVCEQKFKTGQFYLKHGKRDSALLYFKDIVTNFPESMWANQASTYLD